MKRLLTPCSLLFLVWPIVGCSSPASESSPESVRDPLGIDRAVNDYYFPNGMPAPSEDLKGDSATPPNAHEENAESGSNDNGS